MNKTEAKVFSILIVDDNLKDLQVLGKYLKEEKYEIEFAVNGEAAFKWLDTRRFDLVLLDIHMPGMNGFEVCKIIRSSNTYDKLPIIFLSSESERESILKGFDVGAQDYVTKPFDSRELMARVKTHLALKESHENLEKLNLSLERRVQDRTMQLTEAYSKLEAANLKLGELDKSKSEFLHMISHEIRTPLNEIVNSVNLLIEEEMSSDIITLVYALDESVKRLEKFSLSALLITQLRTNTGKILKKAVKLSDLISICVENSEIETLRRKKNIRFIVTDIPPELKVTGSQEMLSACITAILENAIKFARADSSVHIDTMIEKHSILLEISDSGPGFPEEVVELVNNSSSSDELVINFNVGLGLTLAKIIMAHHMGKIKIENNNTGAGVKIYFNVS